MFVLSVLPRAGQHGLCAVPGVPVLPEKLRLVHRHRGLLPETPLLDEGCAVYPGYGWYFWSVSLLTHILTATKTPF
jgi:hypothetical protein